MVRFLTLKDYDDEKGKESSDRNVSLLCEDVELTPCNTLETCLVEAKKMMDVCGVLDTHNDLPYTFAKYQNAENHTQATGKCSPYNQIIYRIN